MSKFLLPFYLILLTLSPLKSQTDSIPGQPPLPERIASARDELLASFLADDPAGALLWRDSLMRLEDSSHAALVWDERWLLYYWEEAYGSLFDEVVRFDEVERQRLAGKLPPPADSLFIWLDNVLYERRFELYEKISRGFLTEEEKQFALLELDYLLRLNQSEQASGEWNKRLDAFLKVHPESRFRSYINANLYTTGQAAGSRPIKTDRGLNIDLLFTSGRWRDQLERTLKTPYGFDVGLAYWVKRWNFGVRCMFDWQKLSKAVIHNGFEWPESDPTVFIAPSLDLGFSVVKNDKLTVFPSVGAGLSILKPPAVDEETDNPPPDYYSEFSFVKGLLSAALTADVKLMTFDEQEENISLGVRIRFGYNRLYFGGANPALRGDMFFFSVGVNLSGYAFY